MQKSIIITLLTDFGQKDWFVAAMKGEILKINPQVRIIDITHEIQPHNIKSAAFVLWSVYKNFPKQTIHTVVVDPGVGTDRRPIVVKTDDYYFVGPDNGVFSYIFHNEHYYAYQIKIRKRLSKTFHGRDLFAPVAALISKRIKISRIAQPLSKPKSFSFPQPKITRTGIRGEVLYIDRFGNIITNIKPSDIKHPSGYFLIKNKKIWVGDAYGCVKKGALLSIEGSTGFFEISQNQKNAADYLKIKLGDRIDYIWAKQKIRCF